jgi:hypothetical protein
MIRIYFWVCLVCLCFGYVGEANAKHLHDVSPKLKVSEEVGDNYEVIVIGGEPEGVAAAVSAARNGAKTLLIEKRSDLGGLFTFGMLNFLDIPQGADGSSVSKGIFQEWHNLVGGRNSFSIIEAKKAFRKLVQGEPNITLLLNTEVVSSIMEGNRVKAVKLKNQDEVFEVKGKAFIDATQDADFAVMSNVPYFTGAGDIGNEDRKMAVTLMIHLKGVNWEKVKATAKSKKFGNAVVRDSVAWGFNELHYLYSPIEENTRLRGLNIAKIGEEYYINALQIFGVDGLKRESKEKAIEKGKRETEHILEYLRKEFPGFEQANIASIPTELYVRETRHIKSEYQLPMSDIWMNLDHWDSIGLGGYPVDVQAQTPNDYGYVLADPKQYSIPFRSLIPKEIDGILVVGRSSGFSSLAAGSARVVPTGMVTGQAAGAAAVIAANNEISFRWLSNNRDMIQHLRTKLVEQGALVQNKVTDYPYKGEWFDMTIQTLINYGLISGGYKNDMHVDEAATRHGFANMLKSAMNRSNPTKAKQLNSVLQNATQHIFSTADSPVELEEAAAILVEVFLEKEKANNNWETLINQGLIPPQLAEIITPQNHELKRKEMYAICASVIDYMNNSEK